MTLRHQRELAKRDHPALFTLDNGGFEAGRPSRRKYKGRMREFGSIALHTPIAHILGEPCISTFYPPKGFAHLWGYRQAFKVLEHETLHHVLQDLLGDPNRDTLDALLNGLPLWNPVKVRLGFNA